MLAAHAEDRVDIERRRPGRPRHVPLALDVMRRSEGRPLTPRELAGLAGMSVDKVRDLVKVNHIRGVAVRSANGVRTQWLIPYAESQRFLRELRVL